MKKFYVCFPFFFFFLLASGQSEFEIELQQRFWKSSNEKQNITAVPEKWKGESAVILYLEQNYKYSNTGKKMFYPSFYHERIALLDKAAVEEYSEFSYDKSESYGGLFIPGYQYKTILGIKIVKPNGTERILNIDQEKVVQDDQVKVAVPGLEIGDILDIFMYRDDFSKTADGSNAFEPVETVMSTSYPVLYRKLSINIEKNFFLNMQTYNGAPEVKEVSTEKNRTRKYVLEATNIEKNDFPRWFYPLVELAAIKFQVVFAQDNHSSEAFLAENDALRKTGVNEEEIFDYYSNNSTPFLKPYLKDVLKHLKDKEGLSKREQMLAAFYYARHKNFNKFIEIYLSNQNGILGYDRPCEGYTLLGGENFVRFMAGIAIHKEVDYDIILATKDYNGSIDSLLLQNNLMLGMRMNFPEPLYFFKLSPNAQAHNFPAHLEGTKAYVFEVERDGWQLDEERKDQLLPISLAVDNKLEERVTVNFEQGFDLLKVDRKMEFSGHFKPEAMENWLFLGDFLEEEFTKYGTQHFYHCSRRLDNDDERVMKKMKALMLSLEEKHEKGLKESIDENYDLKVENYSHSVVNAARYSRENFAIADSFTIKNQFIQKAGPNYLFEAGKFIGGQVQIEKEEMERNVDVDIDFAKTYVYQVEIKIPEGFQVVGLDNLQVNVANDTGSFVATASVENGVLKYNTVKTYAKSHYEEEEWEQMLPWLKAAYDFSQEKVMFKKI
ncbi:MAG TPA: DUF3857 domain-containing protein [Flavobacteriaceae bacterium]|nr:DUF3857 domain-containing protein [Flavobacteriaceae bacterium]